MYFCLWDLWVEDQCFTKPLQLDYKYFHLTVLLRGSHFVELFIYRNKHFIVTDLSENRSFKSGIQNRQHLE